MISSDHKRMPSFITVREHSLAIMLLLRRQRVIYFPTRGNQNAFIMANDFHPLQVRISDAIAVSPNEEGGKSGKFLGRHNRNIIRGPEVAYLVSGQIARSAYTDQFVKENHFF